MAKKSKKSKTPATGTVLGDHANLAPGIGLDTTLRQGYRGEGSTYMERHWVAIGSHPINGIRVVGPFLDRGACKVWIASEQCEYMSLELADHVQDYTWACCHLDVLTTDGN